MTDSTDTPIYYIGTLDPLPDGYNRKPPAEWKQHPVDIRWFAGLLIPHDGGRPRSIVFDDVLKEWLDKDTHEMFDRELQEWVPVS